jgi:hypothetical protein
VFAFVSIPNGAAPACEGETLYLDYDGDGETDRRDAAHGYAYSRHFGDAIDSDGRTIEEFCTDLGGSAGRGQPNPACKRLDYRNDEPLRKKTGDCKPTRPDPSSSWECSAAEFTTRTSPPSVPARSCLGQAVIDDADRDGEPDPTDRCANTPRGDAIDGDGCSVAQFCEQQSVSECRRADFGNDEPLAKKPGDCARTSSTPRACGAAN